MSHYVTLPSNGSDLQTKMGIRNNTQADFAIDFVAGCHVSTFANQYIFSLYF